MMDDLDPERRQQIRTFALTTALVAVVLASSAILLGTGASLTDPVQGAETVEPYYENETASDGPESGWFGSGDATLDTIVDMFVRAPSYIIGTGDLDPSGTGYTGVLLTGVVMAVAAIGAIAGVGIGPVGGAVVALTVGFGLARAGLAPPWVRVLMLFGLGTMAAIAIRRAQG